MRITIFWLLLWLLAGIWNTGVVYADFTHSFPLTHKAYTERRSTLAFAIFWGGVLAPVSTFIAPFTTGFYVHGWDLNISKLPVCRHNEEANE